MTNEDRIEISQMIEHALNARGVAHCATAVAYPIMNPCDHEWTVDYSTTVPYSYCTKCRAVPVAATMGFNFDAATSPQIKLAPKS